MGSGLFTKTHACVELSALLDSISQSPNLAYFCYRYFLLLFNFQFIKYFNYLIIYFSIDDVPFSIDHVYIEATVLEKTKGRNVIVFKKKRRKNYKRWKGIHLNNLL